MAVLEHLEPKSVFSFFEQICAIPHGSGNTKAISDYLVRFAEARALEHYQDALNNVIIIKEAAPGYESAEPVILQGHMDMVCEKAPDCTKDMASEGLDLAVEGDTVYARGTTLGGDDGIAVAMALAVLDDPDLPHPRIEAVFTVDEETGMDGAFGIDVSPLKAKRLINIDSEAEGIFTVSCAGGCRANCVIPVTRAPFSGAALRVDVEGLAGGHSGTEIDKGRANADKLLGRVLLTCANRLPLRIISVSGGLKDNAIPTAACATLIAGDEAALRDVCAQMDKTLKEEFCVTDPGVAVRVSAAEAAAPMDEASTRRVLCLLTCVPNGIQTMSADIKGLVQTSLNLGILTTQPDSVSASFSVRSSVESQKKMLLERLACLTEQLGGSVSTHGDYPGWAYRQESPLRDLLTAVYTDQYGHPPVIEAIHAGLECGLFSGKIPGLDCISIGPDLTDIHTFREKLHVASTARTWALVTEALKRMK